jgi:flagellar biosynthesis protein FlhG
MISITGQFLNVKVEYLGFIYDDQAVSTAVYRQRPFMVTDPKSRASLCVQHIVGRMEKSELREGNRLGGLFKRVFSRY